MTRSAITSAYLPSSITLAVPKREMLIYREVSIVCGEKGTGGRDKIVEGFFCGLIVLAVLQGFSAFLRSTFLSPAFAIPLFFDTVGH